NHSDYTNLDRDQVPHIKATGFQSGPHPHPRESHHHNSRRVDCHSQRDERQAPSQLGLPNISISPSSKKAAPSLPAMRACMSPGGRGMKTWGPRWSSQQVTFNTTSALFGLFGALCPMLLVILPFTFRRVEFATNICHVHMRRWQLQAHLTHRVSNDLRYGKIPEPLVIGWNDVPRRMLCAGQSDGVLVRLYVFWP